MAYDENGKWYLDPQLDGEDAELVEQAGKIEQAHLYRTQQKMAADQAKFTQDSWAEALKDADLTQEEYNNLIAQDPAEGFKLVKESMKTVARNVARRKGGPAPQRNAQGQFVQPQAPAGQPQPNETIETAKKKVDTGGQLSEADELDVLNAVLGGVDLLK